jgi:hypothetical protein
VYKQITPRSEIVMTTVVQVINLKNITKKKLEQQC